MSLSAHNIYEMSLDQNPANYVPLTPLTFIERAASVYPHYTAVVHGPVRRDWAETYARCRRLASALQKRGIGLGHTVAAMLPNIPEMFEAHFGVPMSGATLNTLNIRLDAETIAFMLEHGEAKILLTDREFSETIGKALKLVPVAKRPLIIDVDDPQFVGGEKGFSNWELSANRANASRREMIAGGMDENKVLRVVGLSSTVLFDKNDPLSSSNRRINIVVLNKRTEEAMLQEDGNATVDVGADTTMEATTAAPSADSPPAGEM